jgi:hypothetical protein
MVYRLRVTAKLFPKSGRDIAAVSIFALTKELEYALNRRVDHVTRASGDRHVFNVDGWPGDVDFCMRSLPTFPEVSFNSERVVIEII